MGAAPGVDARRGRIDQLSRKWHFPTEFAGTGLLLHGCSSTISIPNPAPMSPMEAIVNPPPWGSRLDADHPQNGVLIPCRFTLIRRKQNIVLKRSQTQASSRVPQTRRRITYTIV